MTFDTDMASLNAGFLSQFGESIGYTMKGSEQATITAVVERGEGRLEQLDDGQSLRYVMTIQVQTSDVTTLTLHGDSVSIDSLTWSVDDLISEDAGLYVLQVSREANDEYSRPGFRRTP